MIQGDFGILTWNVPIKSLRTLYGREPGETYTGAS
jgi:hypothetical protein